MKNVDEEIITEEPDEQEPLERLFSFTYNFYCAEGTDPADQLDQDFYDINHNFAKYGTLEEVPPEPESICTPEGKTAEPLDIVQIPKNDLKEFLEILDQKATEDEDEEVPPEYYEGIFSTINDIRRKFGIPLVSH